MYHINEESHQKRLEKISMYNNEIGNRLLSWMSRYHLWSVSGTGDLHPEGSLYSWFDTSE